MRIMRAAPAGTAVLVAVLLSTSGAYARSPVDFSLRLTSGAPSSPAGAALRITYRAPGNPYAKPSPLRRVAITLPAGARYDGGAVPSCKASDAELMLRGPAACPAASIVGRGTVTALTGLGAPVDPVVLDATFINTGGGISQDLTEPGTNLGLLVLHGSFTAPGTLTFDRVPTVPGGPPEFASSVRDVLVRLNEEGTQGRSFITTPATCPASHRWRSTLVYATADGHTYTAHSRTPCGHTVATPLPSVFKGVCQLSGTVSFAPRLTLASQSGAVSATATGTCDGSVTDGDGAAHTLNAAAASLLADSRGTESCALGVGSGRANLTVARQAVAYDYSELRAGPALVLSAAGPGGSALAEGNVSPSENPATVLQACGTTGLGSAPIDIRLVGH